MIVSAVMLLGRAAGLPAARRAKRLAEDAAATSHPARLTVISARPCFPASGGAEILFRVADDPDAFVRLRVDRVPPAPAELRDAVDAGLAAADRWRQLSGALRQGGHEVYGLGRLVAEPWIAAAPSNDTVEDLLSGLHACLRGQPGLLPASVMIAEPAVVRALPRDRDPSLPTLLRLNANRRLAALSGRRPYYRASFGVRGTPELSLVQPFALWQRYEDAVAANAATWLAEALPGTGVSGVMSRTQLVPGRVDRVRVHVVFHEEGATQGNHALTLTTDLAGSLVGPPAVHHNLRDGPGPLHLPPLLG